MESIKKIPWLFPAPSFPERFHTCRGRNCESAFPSPNFKSCRNHLPGSTYVLSSMRGRKHICWKEMEILKTSWVVIKTLQILLTSFPLGAWLLSLPWTASPAYEIAVTPNTVSPGCGLHLAMEDRHRKCRITKRWNYDAEIIYQQWLLECRALKSCKSILLLRSCTVQCDNKLW